MPFQKGQSGNPKGRPKSSKLFKDALSLALASRTGNRDDGLREIARALIAKALEGDIRAIREIADRLDGRPARAVTGEEDGTVTPIIREVVLRDGSANP